MTKKFEEYDSPPNIWYSPGLLVVKNSIDKGLATLVHGSLNKEEGPMMKAKEMGAGILRLGDKNILNNAYNFFSEKLLD